MEWLLVQGGANDQSGHVEQTVIRNPCIKKKHSAVLLKCIDRLIGESSNQFGPPRASSFASPAADKCVKSWTRESPRAQMPRLLDSSTSSFLHLLRGNEETLLQLIADYVT